VVWVGRRLLFAIVSDEDWSRVHGLPVDRMNVLLAALAAAVVVAGMRIVGLLLVAALLVMPVASAQSIARSFRTTMLLASAIGAGCAAAGLGLGLLLDVQPGGVIVLLASAVFAATAVVTRRAPRTLRQEEHA
jgi:zinc transport system permease protein